MKENLYEDAEKTFSNTVSRGGGKRRKCVFCDAIQYFAGQRYTLTKLQNAGNFQLFSHRDLTTAKKV